MGHVPVVRLVPDLILALVVEPVAFPELGEHPHHALLSGIRRQAPEVGLVRLAHLGALVAVALVLRPVLARPLAARLPAWPGQVSPLRARRASEARPAVVPHPLVVVTAIHRLSPISSSYFMTWHCGTCHRPKEHGAGCRAR